MLSQQAWRISLRYLVLLTGVVAIFALLVHVPQGTVTHLISFGIVGVFGGIFFLASYGSLGRNSPRWIRRGLRMAGLSAISWSGMMIALLLAAGQLRPATRQFLQFSQVFLGGMLFSILLLMFTSGEGLFSRIKKGNRSESQNQ